MYLVQCLSGTGRACHSLLQHDSSQRLRSRPACRTRCQHASPQHAAQEQHDSCMQDSAWVTRRDALLAAAGVAVVESGWHADCARASSGQQGGKASGAATANASGQPAEAGPLAADDVGQFSVLDYAAPAGPLQTAPFPELEHTCSRCFPACLVGIMLPLMHVHIQVQPWSLTEMWVQGNRCMLRLEVVFPKNGRALGVALHYARKLVQTMVVQARWRVLEGNLL